MIIIHMRRNLDCVCSTFARQSASSAHVFAQPSPQMLLVLVLVLVLLLLTLKISPL